MKKLLILLVWLLGLAAIAWFCSRGPGTATAPPVALAPPMAAPTPPPPAAAAEPAATPPPAVSITPPAPPPPPPPVAAPPAVTPSPQAAAAGAEIDTLLKDKVVEFRSGSAILTGAGRAVVATLLPILKGNPGLKFEVQGHTDNTGSDAVNLALSQARADAVKAQLTRQGIATGRLGAKGFGAAQPVADNNTAEGRARNRRIALRVEENKQ